MDRIFPKDLPIGVITQVKPGSQYKQIRVRPSANVEKLEEVIVLLTTDPLTLKQDAAPITPSATVPSAAISTSGQPIAATTNPKPAEKHP
jgi:cell shape-determining protein MreC